MQLDVYAASARALENGEPAALVTVIYADSRWNVGDKMLVRRDNSLVGDLSDARLTQVAATVASRAITTGNSQRLGWNERDGALVDTSPFEIGDVEIFIQVLQPSPTLLLIGAGHIGQALVQYAKMCQWRVVVIDDRPDFLAPERLPGADERIFVRYEPQSETLDAMPLRITPSTFIVVATWGWDEPALKQIVGSSAAYIGLVASSRKAIIIFRELIKDGISPEQLARVRVPIGLDLGGELPTEIALAIMAEILMAQHGASGAPLAQSKGTVVMKQARAG